MSQLTILDRFRKHVAILTKLRPTGVEDLLHGAVLVAKEAGELLDEAYRVWHYEKQPDVANLKEEVGDILFGLQDVCEYGGFTLEEAMEENIEKLRKRYPDGYSNEAALARADKVEEINEAYCSRCDIRFSSEEDLTDHYIEVH